MRQFIIFIFLLFSTSHSQVIETQYGKAEVLGLQNWSLQRLLDTLAVKAPGLSVDRCAAKLQDLGFPDAAVHRYYDNDGQFYSVVTIIEPAFSRFVKYKKTNADTLPLLEDWKKIVELRDQYPIEFQYGLLKYQILSRAQLDTIKFSNHIHKEKIFELWDFLQSHNSETDKELAIWVLNKDGNYLNRIAATTILINFFDRDLTWWSLVDAMRDMDARVRDNAEIIMRSFAGRDARKINWQPARYSLTCLLNGTNLFVFKTLLETFSKIKIPDNVLRRVFKQSKAFLVLSYLKANREEEHTLAHNFLTNSFNKDFGLDVKKWENYIEEFVNLKE